MHLPLQKGKGDLVQIMGKCHTAVIQLSCHMSDVKQLSVKCQATVSCQATVYQMSAVNQLSVMCQATVSYQSAVYQLLNNCQMSVRCQATVSVNQLSISCQITTLKSSLVWFFSIFGKNRDQDQSVCCCQAQLTGTGPLQTGYYRSEGGSQTGLTRSTCRPVSNWF